MQRRRRRRALRGQIDDAADGLAAVVHRQKARGIGEDEVRPEPDPLRRWRGWWRRRARHQRDDRERDGAKEREPRAHAITSPARRTCVRTRWLIAADFRA